MPMYLAHERHLHSLLSGHGWMLYISNAWMSL